MKKAIYALSADPITFGHLDVIERAAKVFDKLIVAIGNNPTKKYLFTMEERTELAKRSTGHISNVDVVFFSGLLVDFAYENNILTIIRGLRNTEDFNFEIMLHQIGESQKMNIDTFFIPTRQSYTHISSGAVKAIQLEQGIINEYVPLVVKQRLEEKISGQIIIGVTGEIGAGKSFICDKLVEFGKQNKLEITKINIDAIAHEILCESNEPVYIELRRKIRQQFDIELTHEGYVDTKKLGKILFDDIEKLNRFNSILIKPLLLKIRRVLHGKRGIILLDSALIAESKMTYLCNNNVILVKTSKEQQLKRLKARNYSEDQIKSRLNSQYNFDLKYSIIEDEIKKTGNGKIEILNNEYEPDSEIFAKILHQFY